MDSVYIILLAIYALCWSSIFFIRLFGLRKAKKKHKGVKRKMPIEMLKEFLDKECTITLFNDIFTARGKIIAIDENWIKFEEKKRIRVINGDMIRDISISK